MKNLLFLRSWVLAFIVGFYLIPSTFYGQSYSDFIDLPLRAQGSWSAGSVTGVDIDKIGNMVIGGVYRNSVIIDNKTFNAKTNNNFLAKYDNKKNLKWSINIKSNSFYFHLKPKTDSKGNVWIAGLFQDSITIQHFSEKQKGSQGLYIAKFSPIGNLIWIETGSLADSATRTRFELNLEIDNQDIVHLFGTTSNVDSFRLGNKQIITKGTLAYMVEYQNNGTKSFSNTIPATCRTNFWGINSSVFNKTTGNYYFVAGFQDSLYINKTLIKKYNANTKVFYTSAIMKFSRNGKLTNHYLLEESEHPNLQVSDSGLVVTSNYSNTLYGNGVSFIKPNSNKRSFYLLKLDTNLKFKWINYANSDYNISTGIFSVSKNSITCLSFGPYSGTTFHLNGQNIYYYGLGRGYSVWRFNSKNGNLIESNRIISSLSPTYTIPSTIKDLGDGKFLICGSTSELVELEDKGKIGTIDKKMSAFVLEFLSKKSNKIIGLAYYDSNFNKTIDSTEIKISGIQVVKVKDNIPYITDKVGEYLLYVDTGKYTIAIKNKLKYHLLSKDSIKGNFQTYGMQDTINFGFQPIKGITDVGIKLFSLRRLSRLKGFYRVYIDYENFGTDTIKNGSFGIKLDSGISISYSSVPYTRIVNDSVIWNYSNLKPYEKRQIIINCKIDSFLKVGSVIQTSGHILPIKRDTFKINNADTIKGILILAHDPNIKSNIISTISLRESLKKGINNNYTITFQNTGTAPASDVVVKDTIEYPFDLSSIEIVGSSHPVELKIKNINEINFNFWSINLPDSGANFDKSIGYVQFKIKGIYDTLKIKGDSIKNRASIYFDYNDAVHTNYSVLKITNKSPEISGISNTMCLDSTYTGQITSNGYFYLGNRFVLELSDELGSFASSSILKTVIDTGNSKINFTIPTSQKTGIQYKIRVRSTTPKTTIINSITTYSIQACSEDTTGINENKISQSIQVYPNPNHGLVYIDLSNISSSEIVSASIYNIEGKLIYDEQVATGAISTINLENQKPGSYVLIIKNNEGGIVKQVSIQKTK